MKVASGEGQQPMGFGLGKSSREKPKMQLVACPAHPDFAHLSALSDADAGILHVSTSAELKTLEKLCQNAGIPWGGWLKKSGNDGTAKLSKASCDFVVFSSGDTPLSVPKDEKLGRIIEVDASFSEGLLRSIEDLPVDAVFATREKEKALTWLDLMQFRRLAGLVVKPLLVAVSSKVTIDELQALWDVGVSGVVIELEDEPSWERLASLRKEVDKVTPTAKRKRVKDTALLPRLSPEAPQPVEEEEEED